MDNLYHHQFQIEEQNDLCGIEMWPEPWIQLDIHSPLPFLQEVIDQPIAVGTLFLTQITSNLHIVDPIFAESSTLTDQKKSKRFACSDCSTKFSRINDLKRHQVRHLAKDSSQYIQCTECPMKFTRCYSFRRHCHRKHSFLLSNANIKPMKSAMTELQLQIWEWCQNANTPIDTAVLMSTKKRKQTSISQ